MATSKPKQPIVAEQESAGVLQWPLYTWVTPLLQRGTTRMNRKQKLETQDLLYLPTFETPACNAEEFSPHWEKEMEGEQPSLIRALRSAFQRRVMIGGMLRFISDFSAFAAPFILKQLILWMQDRRKPIYQGFMWVGLLAVANLVMSMCLNAASHNTMTGFTQMATALQVKIFNKALDLGPNHGKTGEITTLHTVHTARFVEMAMFVHGLWVSPLLVIAATIALYFFIGYSGIIAVVLMILFVPFQGMLMQKAHMFRGFIIKKTDLRVAAVNEVFQGIRICKFMNWENRFIKRIFDTRAEEVAWLDKIYSMRAIIFVVTSAIPTLVTFCLFSIAYASGAGIKAETVFPALSMLNVIRIPVMFIPMSIAKLFELKISTDKIQTFLLSKRHEQHYSKPDSDEFAAQAKDLTVYKTDSEDPLLDKVSFNIPKGKLVAVVGATGSGKSTVVNALLGEGEIDSKSVIAREGTVSYVPQEPWIMNATVKSNIIMDNAFDQDKYDRTVAACQLADDFNQLADGDDTEIGERGINLSGGQKQRIAFARAVYSDRDIVVMDDPLSAVDAHVCQALFEHCIDGALKGKTRILVTHQVQFLNACDKVIAMEDCKVTFDGPPSDYPLNTNESASPQTPSEKKRKETAKEEGPGKDKAVDLGASPKPTAEKAKTDKGKLIGKEDVEFGDIDTEVYYWYLRLGTYQWAALCVLGFTLWRTGTVLVDFWLAVWSGQKDAFGRKYTNIEYLYFFAIFVVISVIMAYIRQYLYAKFMLRVAYNAHDSLVKMVIHAPTYFFDTTPMGRILNRFTADIDKLDNKIPETTQMVLQLSFMIFGMLFLVAFSTPYILVIVPFLFVIFYNMYRYYSQTVRGVKRIEGTARSPMMAIMSETLNGLSTIRAYDLSDYFVKTHERRAAAAARPMYCQRCCQRWLAARTEFIGSVILFGTGYLSATSRALGDSSWNVEVDANVAALSMTYALATTNAITFLTRMLADLESDFSSTERVYEYSHKIPQENDITYGTGPDECPAPPKDWPSEGKVEFRDVELRYRDGLPLVLKKISATIPPMSKVGVVGRTGSGKSTIMLALFRMVELAGGSILIDGIPTTNVTMSDLRGSITIIPQDPVLFAGSIRSNLDPFNQYEDEELWDVVKKVGMYNRLKPRAEAASAEASPQNNEPVQGGEEGSAVTPAENGAVTPAAKKGGEGLSEEVQERGANFSVGQRQLLCLARALLKRCRILLMDEATASVDFETDALIQRVIREEFKQCTVLTIAHRLATIIDSDKVLVMADGNIEEFDAPKTLLDNSSGVFHSMVSQLGDEQFKELYNVAKTSFEEKHK